MNNDNKTTTRKRPHEEEEEEDDEQRREGRFDFVYSDYENNENEDLSDLFEKLAAIKQRLNDVKGLLSDKDIADWNRHTAYMNTASTIVPYLREKLHIEVGTQAWAKMFEILANFDLIHHENDQKWITLHLCEAPGAFISALNHFLVTRNENIDWQWFAQTLNPYYEHDPTTATMLIEDDRLIFHTIDGNHWDFGSDNSGNIMAEENIDHYIARFQPMGISLVITIPRLLDFVTRLQTVSEDLNAPSKLEFITADGSFDVQDNPGEQELLVYPLLKTEVHVALSCLMTHGNFVLKIFTMFERETIELIDLLYRTFRQISMLKPKTSKKGNSEVYVICRDFDREKYTASSSSSDHLPLSPNFLHQLIQCAQLFQSQQINTIEHNLHYFNNLNRRFIKKLHQIKDQTLDAFLNQCQVRELLLSNDRHLLNVNHESQRFDQLNQRITRTGTFNNQHQMDKNFIEGKIRNGFFCLICSKDENNDLCSTCQILPQIINDRSLSISRIYIGELIANKRTIIECVFGKQSENIRNSCFCNRYLLELCQQFAIYKIDDSMDLELIKNSSATEMSKEELAELQQFTCAYQIHVRNSKNGVYHVQSSPILTRLQASVIYILTRLFQKTSVYVIPSSSPSLLFLFEIFQPANTDEYQGISSRSNAALLQFVHIHQLLDQHFAFNLIQANNWCLQMKYIIHS